jgi:Zn-dependent M28 family amino/carboxypeptidase
MERRKARGESTYTLVFVAYDGEEVALYGGYDYLRKHRIVGKDPILAVLNFEMPSARMSSLLGLARSNHQALDDALKAAGLGIDYPLYAGMELVPTIFGGLIPTDIQGIYRNGVPTASTAVDSPWYHTVEDTPDKVDLDAEALDVDDFDKALGLLLADDKSAFAGLDDKLWQATMTAQPRGAGDPLVVDVTVTDAAGVAQANASVDAVLLVDDFFAAATVHVTTDAAGHATVTFDAAAAAMGAGNRFVHISAGPTVPQVSALLAFPYVEQILPAQ